MTAPDIKTWSQAKTAGDLFYFTGKPCKRGHIVARYVTNGNCLTCIQVRCLAWEKDNAEKRRAMRMVWRKANPEKRRIQETKHRNKNLEKFRAKERVRSKRNPEQKLINSRRWRERNPEVYRAKGAIWRRKNPEAHRALLQARRARKRSAEGRFSAHDIKRILKQQLSRCAFYIDCKTSIARQRFHVDHIQPLVRGGSNWPHNIQLLCPTCNMKKSKLDPLKYAERQGRLV